MTWQAHLTDGMPYDLSVRLHIFRRHSDGKIDILKASGWMETVEEGIAVPDDAGLMIPREALAAVAEAFHPHATGQARLEGEMSAVKEMLRVESGRVEKLINRALEG